VLAATTEVAAGILLAVGLLTSLAGAAFVALMLVAAWTVHRTNGFFSVRNGWEYNLVLATIGVAVAICGPGRFSIDHVIGIDNDLNGLWGVLISAVGGVAAGSLQLLAFYRPEAAAKAATTSSV
jgi:putative oxidoreductase